MDKVAIKGDISNKLDFCPSCDEAWLDKGEWQLLHNLALSGKIASIITGPWQNRVRKEISALRIKEHFTKIIGESDFSHAKEFKDWVENHPKRHEILRYLNQQP